MSRRQLLYKAPRLSGARRAHVRTYHSMSAADLYPDAFVKVSLNDADAEKQRDPAAEPWYRIGG